MAAKFVIFAFAVSVCHAGPFATIGKSPGAVHHHPSPHRVLHPYPHGDSQAYSSAVANSQPGASYAHGDGITYNTGLHRNYGSAVSSAQNFGNSGTAVAHSNTAGQGSAVASASNLRGLGYGSAVSSATSNNGLGSAVSSAYNSGYGTAVSSAQTRGGLGDYSSAVSASENVGGVSASTSHAVQQGGDALQHRGATSIDAPGVHAAYPHAVNNNHY